jgi:hypothetical protein
MFWYLYVTDLNLRMLILSQLINFLILIYYITQVISL